MRPKPDATRSAVVAPLVKLAEVSKGYDGLRGRTCVLSDVSLELPRSTSTSVMGASGSGKSTLLSLIAGLSVADSGRIVVDGTDVTSSNESQRARLRASRVGVVAQNANLLPYLTAVENVELALHLAACRRGRRQRAAALLVELGLADRTGHLPRHLSGGESQRVALAMALAKDPVLLLGDEMTGELDSDTAEHVMSAVLEVCRARGMSVVYVTHSTAMADLAQHRLVVSAGNVRVA